MLDKQTLKKHNLKAVPFSCIGEGETFNIEDDFWCQLKFGHVFYTRKRLEGNIVFASTEDSILESVDGFAEDDNYETVYVPVWRVT